MIITVTLNPALDKSLTVSRLAVDGVNRVTEIRRDAGGKGINISKMVRALGGDTVAMGIVGGAAGKYVQSQLDALGIRHDFVVTAAATRTNYKISDQALHTTTELNEPGEPVTDEVLEQVWRKIDAAARPGDTVAFAGANPPGMGDGVLADWITRLKKKGVVTSLDSVGEPMRQGIKARPNVIKPNQSELSEIFGEQLHYLRDVIAAARFIVQQGVERVIVSMGADGALFVTKDEVLRGLGLHVPVGSTVGSGDTTLAAVLYYLQQGCSWEETARRSIATGAANVMRTGSQPPTLEQIENLVDKVIIEKM